MDSTVLRNEFATIEVARDEDANGDRLRIRDLLTGREVYLDPPGARGADPGLA